MHIGIIESEDQVMRCGICMEHSGTLISPHKNDKEDEGSHLFHFGCLALALHQSSSKYDCPSCLKPLSFSETHQELINNPESLFVAACKAGMTKLIAKLISRHSFSELVIGAGFASATFADHRAIIEFLYNNSSLMYEHNIVCLEIAIQQRNMEMVEFWSLKCRKHDYEIDCRIITEYLDLKTYSFFNKPKGGALYSSAICLFKAVRLDNQDLADHIVRSYAFMSNWTKFRLRWKNFGRKKFFVYGKVCWVCLWGNIDLLQQMIAKNFDLDLYDNLALTCAHFMEHEHVELLLKSHGCRLATESLFYNLADACCNNDMNKLQKYLSRWKRHAGKISYDFVLTLMLILLIRNGNTSMTEYLLTQCRTIVTGGITEAFEYSLQCT